MSISPDEIPHQIQCLLHSVIELGLFHLSHGLAVIVGLTHERRIHSATQSLTHVMRAPVEVPTTLLESLAQQARPA